MNQLGFLDFDIRIERIDNAGDPLQKINDTIDWEIFRPTIDAAREKAKALARKKAKIKRKKTNTGPKGFDAILLFKTLIPRSLYNLSDEGLEYQILDHYSFSRFLGLHAASKVPDHSTIWRFREALSADNATETLFSQFDQFLFANGFKAQKGQIVDASIVRVPIQRDTREENKLIKGGDTPENWHDAKRQQKDTDARWTKKNGKNFFGYKNHICIDVKHKFIRAQKVTSAEVHDSNVFEELLNRNNTSSDVWADSAYRSEKALNNLKKKYYREHPRRKGSRNRKLTNREQQGNRTRSRIRSRVERVFGIQAQRAGNLILRGIGIIRARTKIGLRDLAYNLDRYGTLAF